MTALSDFITTLKGWVNREDVSDAVVTSWIRMGEERINNDLLFKDMFERVVLTFTTNVQPLPVDWISLDYVRYVRDPVSLNPNIKRGRPFDYITKDEYWERSRATEPYTSTPCYTIIGNDIFITGDMSVTAPQVIEIGVYSKIPPLVDANWLYTDYIGLYTFASLAASAPWLVEDERMTTWESKATQLINLMNEKHRSSKVGGSPLKLRRRSFG